MAGVRRRLGSSRAKFDRAWHRVYFGVVTLPSESLWRRFRRLNVGVQALCWLLVTIVAFVAIAGVVGGTDGRTSPTRNGAGGNGLVPNRLSLTTTPESETSPVSTAPLTTPPSAPIPAGPASNTSSSGHCRGGDPLANVYHPYRLEVRTSCITVTGTVAYTENEADGDVHINLSLPATETRLLNQANYTYERGELLVEIVPADEPGCTPGQPPPLSPTAYTSSSYHYGICTGADIPTPPLGSEVSVTGPYVLDSDHGWTEIHPVWSVRIIAGPSAPAATNSSPPPASDTEPPATQPPANGSMAWCQASAVPSNDGYGGDYQVYVHSNQPNTKVTASDAGDTWSGNTNGSGYANVRLYHTSPGMTISVSVGGASCSTTA